MAKKIEYSKILSDGKNKPTNKALWEEAKAAAKKKFDVYPSAVANAWASRYYAEKGGEWKSMAEGGMVGSFASLTDAISNAVSPAFPEVNGGNDTANKESVPVKKPEAMAKGGKVKNKGMVGPPEEVIDGLTYSQRIKLAEDALKEGLDYIPLGYYPHIPNKVRQQDYLLKDIQIDKYVVPLPPLLRKFMEDNAGKKSEDIVIPKNIAAEAERYQNHLDYLARMDEEVKGARQRDDEAYKTAIFKAEKPERSFEPAPMPLPKTEGTLDKGIPVIMPSGQEENPIVKMAKGGYVVTRTDEREGKTHKVTGPGGEVQYFGDPELKNKPNSKEAREAFYARHAKNLKENPFFRAYARSTWADGGVVEGGGTDIAPGTSVQDMSSPVVERTQEPQIGDKVYDTEGTLRYTIDDSNIEDVKKLRLKSASPNTYILEPEEPVAASPAAPVDTNPVAVAAPAGKVTATFGEAKPVDAKKPLETDEQKAKRLKVEEAKRLASNDFALNIADQLGSKEAAVATRTAAGKGPLAALLGAIKAREEAVAAKPKDATEEAANARVTRRNKILEGLLQNMDLGSYGAIGQARLRAEAERSADRILDEEEKLDIATAEAKAVLQGLEKSDKEKSGAGKGTGAEVPADGATSTAGTAATGAAPSGEGLSKEDPKVAAEKRDIAIGDRALQDIRAATGNAKLGEPKYGATIDTPEELALFKSNPANAAALAAAATALAPSTIPAPGAPTAIGPAAGTAGATEGMPPTALSGIGALPDNIKTAIADPVLRYGQEAQAALQTSGDWKLVYQTALASGMNKADAARVATDEVARTLNFQLPALPTAGQAATYLRATPEMRDMAEAAKAGFEYKEREAELAYREKLVSEKIKAAQLDAQIARQRDYTIKRAALDAQTAEVRRQVSEGVLRAEQLFVTRNAQLTFSNPAVWMALLGDALSGAGANGVLANVRSKIAEDMQTQLQVVDRRRTILGDLLKAGNTLDESYKLGSALLAESYAARIESTLGMLPSERAKAAALAAANKLKFEAAKDREDALQKGLDNVYRPYELRLKAADRGVKDAREYLQLRGELKKAKDALGLGYAELKTRRDELQLRKDEFDQKRKDKLLASNNPDVVAFVTGQPINPGQLAVIRGYDKDLPALAVRVPKFEKRAIKDKSGNVREIDVLVADPERLAASFDAKSAQEARDFVRESGEFIDQINELEAIYAKYDYDNPLSFSEGDAKKISVGRAKLAGFLGRKSQLNTGTPQETEYKRLMEIVPELETWRSADRVKANLDALRKGTLRATEGALDQYLVGGKNPQPRARPTMPAPVGPVQVDE